MTVSFHEMMRHKPLAHYTEKQEKKETPKAKEELEEEE